MTDPNTGSTNRLVAQTEGWTPLQYCARIAALERERDHHSVYAEQLQDAGYEAWHSWADGVDGEIPADHAMMVLAEFVTVKCPDCSGEFGEGDWRDFCATCKGFGRLKAPRPSQGQVPNDAKALGKLREAMWWWPNRIRQIADRNVDVNNATAGQMAQECYAVARAMEEALAADSTVEGVRLSAGGWAVPGPWISVDERLPEELTKVLAVWSGGFIYCAMLIEGEWVNSANNRMPDQFITHWMALPAPPSVEGRKA